MVPELALTAAHAGAMLAALHVMRFALATRNSAALIFLLLWGRWGRRCRGRGLAGSLHGCVQQQEILESVSLAITIHPHTVIADGLALPPHPQANPFPRFGASACAPLVWLGLVWAGTYNLPLPPSPPTPPQSELALCSVALLLSALLRRSSSAVPAGFAAYVVCWALQLVVQFGFPYK